MDEFNNQNQPQEQDPWNQPEQQPQAQPTEPDVNANAYSYGTPAQQYAPQDYYYQGAPVQPVNGTSGLAIGSLICGIISLLMFCMSCFVGITIFVAPICAIVGLILGIINNVKKKGSKGMAIGGIVCSAIALVFSVLLIVLAVIGISMMLSDSSILESMIDSYPEYEDEFRQIFESLN